MKQISILFFLLFLLFIQAQAQIIVTSAGTGAGGFSGDGGLATSALLFKPCGIVLDKNENIYLSDNGNRRIRKISPAFDGIITTVAGNGTTGFSGDGFDAIYAQIDGAWDIAIDKKGNLYIADVGNHRIRRVATNGIISTIAGTGIAGYNGDNIPATNAKLNGPTGICIDDTGNIYIADKNSNRIRKIDTFGTITTVVGNGISGLCLDGTRADTAKINEIWCVRVNKKGVLYFTDNNRIRKIDDNGLIITIAGNGTVGDSGDGGLATTAELQVSAFCFDTTGNLFFCDGVFNKIRKIGTDGKIIRVAGAGPSGYSGDGGDPLLAKLNGCSGIAVTSKGDIYIGDMINNRIRMVTDNIAQTINPIIPTSNFDIYPNPVQRILEISFNNPSCKNTNLNIFKLDGVLIRSENVYTNSPTKIYLDFPSGTYLITSSCGSNIFARTFTIY